MNTNFGNKIEIESRYIEISIFRTLFSLVTTAKADIEKQMIPTAFHIYPSIIEYPVFSYFMYSCFASFFQKLLMLVSLIISSCQIRYFGTNIASNALQGCIYLYVSSDKFNYNYCNYVFANKKPRTYPSSAECHDSKQLSSINKSREYFRIFKITLFYH